MIDWRGYKDICMFNELKKREIVKKTHLLGRKINKFGKENMNKITFSE